MCAGQRDGAVIMLQTPPLFSESESVCHSASDPPFCPLIKNTPCQRLQDDNNRIFATYSTV